MSAVAPRAALDQAARDELRTSCLRSLSVATAALLRCERCAAPKAECVRAARAEILSAWQLVDESDAWDEVASLHEAASDLLSIYLRVACRSRAAALREEVASCSGS